MSSVLELHREAMEFADTAVVARHNGDYERAKDLYSKALEKERAAAQLVPNDVSAEPTRSVLLRSAASMALNCGELREAERLIATALTGNPPEEIAEELRELLEQVYSDRHRDPARIVHNSPAFYEPIAEGPIDGEVAGSECVDSVLPGRTRGVQSLSKVVSIPATIGELRSSEFNEVRLRYRSIKAELRENLLARLDRRETIFPGIVGYDDSVVPQIVNALLSRHDFILLGLRGQAKSRILRELVGLLDERIPAIAGCEINDNPYAPICKACRLLIAERGDQTPVTFISRDRRYVEKLATPDVTIADLIGDLDPIKAARGGHLLSDELTIHYGLLPRANRGVFAINELPDLASKVQVGLFNIMQEGDVQIKGYPIRMPLDVMLVFSANPEDYTARGKIITPLKDRIGSEISTHYPATVEEGIKITKQEAWLKRGDRKLIVPEFIIRAVEQIAFEARSDQRVDKRSGVSQRLPISAIENVISNAERRGAITGEPVIVPRISDIYAALPSITGKLELEYEGEQRGAANVARDLVKTAVGKTFEEYFEHVDCSRIVGWFSDGNAIRTSDTDSADLCLRNFHHVDGLIDAAIMSGLCGKSDSQALVAVCELILEGLHAHKKISRSEERGYAAAKPETRGQSFESFSRSRKIN